MIVIVHPRKVITNMPFVWFIVMQVYLPYASSLRPPHKHSCFPVHGGYIDGSADVNAYGKFLYTLMTGLRVFYSIPRPHRGKKSIDSVYGNKQPYIDPRYRTRSLVEGRFVEIIEKCNKHNASERVDIFTVVSHLRETARLAKMNTKG